eukprot:TRINITY_DN57_c1_g1_i1.p1 TRINITY_DN57_c1_g1~~TRINITY_DN57_c1_g1_i1.p1  ORF type:complete len:1532 (-),score=150.70 TRINITY_DN57_c1_g1_i1:6333-10928(-)
MKHSAPTGARRRSSSASQPLMPTATLDFSSFANPAVSFPRYDMRQSTQQSPLNTGASGALPALNAHSQTSIPTYSFPHNAPLPVPKRLDSAQFLVTPKSHEGQFSTPGAQQTLTHRIDRRTQPAPNRRPHWSTHTPGPHKNRAMASKTRPPSSPSPYKQQSLPNFQHFAGNVQSNASDPVRSSPCHGQAYASSLTSFDMTQQGTNHLHRPLQGAHRLCPPSAIASSCAIVHGLQYPVENIAAFHPSPALASIAVAQVMPGSFAGASNSCIASQPICHPPLLAASVAPVLECVISSCETGTMAHGAENITQTQPPMQRQSSSCRSFVLNDQRTCTKLTSSGAQTLTMDPASSVKEQRRSILPGPGHPEVTGHPYHGAPEPTMGSAHSLAPASVPDLPPRHSPSHGGSKNQKQTLTSGYIFHPSWSPVTAAPKIITGSRTPRQMSSNKLNDITRVKQVSQGTRKRARGSSSCQGKNDRETGGIETQTNIAREGKAPVSRNVSQSLEGIDGSHSRGGHPKTGTEQPSSSIDNRLQKDPTKSRRKKSYRDHKTRSRSANGIDEPASREFQASQSLRKSFPLSAIRSQDPNYPLLSNLSDGNSGSNEQFRSFSLSPCDEDEEMRESGEMAKDMRCDRKRAWSELENPPKQTRILPISLRVRPPTNAYSPVSDATQPPLTSHSSGDHSAESLPLCRARRETREKSRQELQSGRGKPSRVAKENKRLEGSPKLARDPFFSTEQTTSMRSEKIPLRLRIRKPKSKALKSSNAPKRAAVPRRSMPPKPSKKRQIPDGIVVEGTENLSSGEARAKRPSKVLTKNKATAGERTGSKRTAADYEVATKKSLSLPLRRMDKPYGKTMDAFVRKPRVSEVAAFTPVPMEQPSETLRDIANKFEAELGNVRREGGLKRILSHPRVGVVHHVRCQLCTELVIESQALIHPRFSASNFFLCSSCHKLVESRVRAEKPVHCESISDEPEAVLKRTALFVTVVENVVQAFPSTERENRDIVSIHECISSREPRQIQERAKFIQLPFQVVALLRVVLRKLGVTIQKNRLRWRMQPIRLPLKKDIVDLIDQAIPPSLEDLIAGSSPGQRVWSTVFPNTELGNYSSAYDIVSDLLSLIGVRVNHLCKGNGAHCSETELCEVQFDLLSVCATMHRAFVMVSGTLTEKLFKIWSPHLAKRFLRTADTRLANETLVGKLDGLCSICASKKHEEEHPFTYYSCDNCGHEFCSLCISTVMGPSEFAFACAGSYKCLLCRVDSTLHGKLLRNVGQHENLAKPKITNGVGGQNCSRMKPQLPMLLVCSNVRRRLLLFRRSEDDASIIGFAKFCEEANEHTCRTGPSSTDAHLPTSAFPTRETAAFESRSGDYKDRCFACKLPLDIPGPRDGRENNNDDEPPVLRCVSENCGVAMHRECSPIEKGRRRRAGRPKWICPRHRCAKCAYRDDSRLFKCRTCPLALCKDHMYKPCEVYVYSEKLFACVHCMKKLNPPRPCLIEKLPKRKNEFTQALNASQAKRRRLAETGSSDGLAKPYPGCIE